MRISSGTVFTHFAAARPAVSDQPTKAARDAAGGGEGGAGRPVAIAGDPRGEAIFDNPLSAFLGFYDLRYIAEQTGGQASLLKDAARALGRRASDLFRRFEIIIA